MDVRLNSEDRTLVRAPPVTYEGKRLNDLKSLIQFQFQISIEIIDLFPLLRTLHTSLTSFIFACIQISIFIVAVRAHGRAP